jgi:MoaA/NifB/PqqE/SkfB family radical SAM enzyme
VRLQDLRAYRDLGPRILGTRLGSTRPFKITLALTDRCDCRCLGCRIWAKPKGAEASPQEVGAMLRSVPTLRWVNLTGGELFLRDDVVELVREVHDAVPRLSVLDFPTTGQRTDRIVCDATAIGEMGIPRVLISVSVEGPPALHDRMRGREGAFENAVRTFAALRRVAGVDVFLGLTLTEENAGLVDETLRAVRARLGERDGAVTLRDLHLNVWVKSPHYYANLDSDVEPPRALGDVLRRARRAREGSLSPIHRIEAAYLRLLPSYLQTGRSPIPCKSLSASVFVAANGDVHPCTVWDRKLGNVRERPLGEIVESAYAKETRRLVAKDRCPGCWSPCEAFPSIVASAPTSLLRGSRDVRRRASR